MLLIKNTKSMLNKNKTVIVNVCIYIDLILLNEAQKINSYVFSSDHISL